MIIDEGKDGEAFENGQCFTTSLANGDERSCETPPSLTTAGKLGIFCC